MNKNRIGGMIPAFRADGSAGASGRCGSAVYRGGHARGDDDPAVMLYWRRQSAQQNHHAPAVVSLGALYVNGDSVPLDRDEI
jgi:hypothetical protein